MFHVKHLRQPNRGGVSPGDAVFVKVGGRPDEMFHVKHLRERPVTEDALEPLWRSL